MSVQGHLNEIIAREGTVHLTLVDPDKQEPEDAGEMARKVVSAGSDGIMVGGSTNVGGELLDETVIRIKDEVECPIILFPASESGISKHADAIFFMSLLNSSDPYFITGAQRVGAPLVKRYGLEPISMGYLIVEPGGTAGRVGKARLIPRDESGTAAAYALAAQYMGMDLVYLEAGSGADASIPLEMLEEVRDVTDITLVVGGGIRTPEVAVRLADAGADILVTGTLAEGKNVTKKIGRIVNAVKKTRK